MEHLEQNLRIEQMDKKIANFSLIAKEQIPTGGWVFATRTSIKMSIRTLAARLKIRPPSLKQIELREKKGAVTLKTLNDIASSLDMKFVYGFVPIDGSLNAMVKKRALLIANSIVDEIAKNVSSKNKSISSDRHQKLIDEVAIDLEKGIPRYFWSDDPADWYKGFLGKDTRNNLINYLEQ